MTIRMRGTHLVTGFLFAAVFAALREAGYPIG